jgi:hypothetical protein
MLELARGLLIPDPHVRSCQAPLQAHPMKEGTNQPKRKSGTSFVILHGGYIKPLLLFQSSHTMRRNSCQWDLEVFRECRKDAFGVKI